MLANVGYKSIWIIINVYPSDVEMQGSESIYRIEFKGNNAVIYYAFRDFLMMKSTLFMHPKEQVILNPRRCYRLLI